MARDLPSMTLRLKMHPPNFKLYGINIMSVEDTLKERAATHGSYVEHSKMSQTLKETLRGARMYDSLSDMQKEALDMICHKISRIVCGNPNHVDHWHDIAGYATLVEQILAVE